MDGIAFHKERAGRTHFRWVFELPHEFTAKQRRRVLEKLGAYMEQQKFTYSAVIHEPDPHNDQRNYHIHLIWYDRPCRKLDGTEADFQWVPEHLRAAVGDERERGLVDFGEWDFAMERHYRSGRSWKTHYPFAAPKSRNGLLKDRKYQKQLRAEYADMVNEVAWAGDAGNIFDPRSFKNRGLPKRPASLKLGSSLHMAEICGFATEIGSGNERARADFERKQINDRWSVRDREYRGWQREVDGAAEATDGPRTRQAVEDLRKRIAEARHAAELLKVVELLELELARESSRAERTNTRLRRASGKGSDSEKAMKLAAADQAAHYLSALAVSNAGLRQELAAAAAEVERTQPLSSAAFSVLRGKISTMRRMEQLELGAKSPERVGTIPPVSAAATLAAPPAHGRSQTPSPADATADPRGELEAIASLIAHFLAAPEGLQLAANTKPGEPRFELTEAAGRDVVARFNDVAANPALHRQLATRFPDLAYAPSSEKSATSPRPDFINYGAELADLEPESRRTVPNSEQRTSAGLMRLLRASRPAPVNASAQAPVRQHAPIPTAAEQEKTRRLIADTLEQVRCGNLRVFGTSSKFERSDGRELTAGQRSVLKVYRREVATMMSKLRAASTPVAYQQATDVGTATQAADPQKVNAEMQAELAKRRGWSVG